MGSSPSKGKLLPGAEGKPALQAVRDVAPAEKMTSFKADTRDEEVEVPHSQDVALPPPEDSIEGDAPPSADPEVAAVGTTESVAETDSPPPQETAREETPTDSTPVKTEKKRRPKGVGKRRRRTEKQGTPSGGATVVDLPPHMVRAHQAAYAYLHPNLSKYNTLLGLLDQAAQTHLSLQPMVGIMVHRLEEINQALEEMAEEGELMMREHGDYMAWPSAVSYVAPAKPGADAAARPPDPPPDLLRQLLQHSTEQMKLVGSSFQSMGNATLEEKADYFASLSRLLSDKLRTKRAAEGRLVQVLLHVEQATMKGFHGDDITTTSEDSGIGGENESLAGSERHRCRHRGGSAGSASCGSGGNVRALLDSPPTPLQNHGGLNEGGEEEEEEEEEDEEMEEEEEEEEDEVEEDECDRPARMRSSSSPPDPSRPLANVAAEHLQHRRPLTAASSAKPKRCTSAGGADPITELQQSQRDLDLRMRSRRRSRGEAGSTEPYCNTYRGQRQHSLSGSGAERGAFQLPDGPPVAGYAPRPPGRNSVRRLINTFSQGVDGRPGQPLANIPPHIKRPRRSGARILPAIGSAEKISNGSNNNNNGSCWPDSKEDLDVDSLPPPPPEVLMDDSFQSTGQNPGRPVTYPRTRLSQRLRASGQNVPVLPNRATVSRNPAASADALKPDPEQDPGGGGDDDDDVGPERETSSALYQQAQKIIHLRNVVGSPTRRRHHHHHLLRQQNAGPPPHRQREAPLHEAGFAQCTPPVTAPPVSRARLPPSWPSVHHRYPGSPQPVASSRPSSPRTVVSAADNNNNNDDEEIVPMVAFSTARSVFCQKENQSGHGFTPSSSSTLPRLWGDQARGRQAARGEAGAPSRRTQSEQRPGVNGQLGMDARRTSSPLGRGGESPLDFGAFS